MKKSICIKGYELDLSQYNEWFEKIPVLKEKGNERMALSLEEKERTVITRLRMFRMESATPLDCMSMIIELQKELDGNL